MKSLNRKIILSCLTFFLSLKSGQGIEVLNDWSYYTKDQVTSFQQIEERDKRFADHLALQYSKYHLINGNLKMAKFYLRRINGKSTKLLMVKRRYEALIAFIENRFQESLNAISSGKFNDGRIYPQICMLRLANLLALNKIKAFAKEKVSCTSLTREYSNQNQFWIDALADIKTKKKDLLLGNRAEILKNVFGDINSIKIWMKLVLFLNKEKVIERTLEELPSRAYQSKKIRELIGFAMYRLGKNKEALEFIEDIESPNADNIRGNIYLKQKKYELALGHFQLALQKKHNSLNALERAIPLTWILGQWQDGLNLLNRLIKPELDPRKKLALDTAFQIRIEDIDNAYKQLNLLEVQFKKKYPKEVGLMKSYVALRRHDMKKLQESSVKECRRYDGLNCWISMQLIYWENLGLTIERDEKTLSLSSFSIEKLKGKAEIKPMKEKIIIDQRDIEELDSNSVNLL